MWKNIFKTFPCSSKLKTLKTPQSKKTKMMNFHLWKWTFEDFWGLKSACNFCYLSIVSVLYIITSHFKMSRQVRVSIIFISIIFFWEEKRIESFADKRIMNRLRFLWPSNLEQPRRVFPILLSSFSRESNKKLMSFYSWKWLCNVLLVKFPSLMLFTFWEKGGIIYTIGLYYIRFKDRSIVKLSQTFYT